MKIKTAKFLLSSPNLKLCPEIACPEFALLGRSNVGKSTFINTLCNNSKLAKTSNTPGKTRLINIFEITTDINPFIIADLPGYGYAKVSKAEQEIWQKNLETYLLKRKNLVTTFQFIDARHDIQNNDKQMQTWLKHNNIPCVNILTKCDYISRNEVSKKMATLKREFQNEVLAFSSKDKIYLENMFEAIEKFIA
ncbi:MAG: YihA family ribosome biogenesis GTP-binding protein [Candidatus Gastranaerophilales bacterium]|nr:YihA family ribosome biogenesis GTP-binding protein [Candidatus Gastranaerophilales bacterium]